MKLSNNTLEILKNFSQINNSITFVEGKKQATISTSKSVAAIATFDESFDKSFSIYDLNNMLAALSIVEDPVITLNDDSLQIKGDNTTIRYRYCHKDVVVSYDPNKEIKLSSITIQLDISKEILSSINKAASLLNAEMICIEAKDGDVYIKTYNPDDENSSSAKFKVGTSDETYSIYFRLQNLKFIADDYTLEISGNKISRWVSKNRKIVYYVSPEKNSTV